LNGMALAAFTKVRKWNGRNDWGEMSHQDRQNVLARPSRPAKILILGHSFIERLEKYLCKQDGCFNNFNLEFSNAIVEMLGTGGRTVKKTRYNDLKRVEQSRPDIVYIELGTNDLCRKYNSPHKIASELHELANDILGLGVSQVIIGQVISRNGRGIPAAVPSINEKITVFNQVCAALFDSSISPGCYFWVHMGLWRSQKALIEDDEGFGEGELADTRLDDGVHLSDLGSARLYRSIRGALIQAMRRIPHILAQ
jgi:lysophospholipase L1-like esterase